MTYQEFSLVLLQPQTTKMSDHRLTENEFYSRESFVSVKDSLVKASSYQFYFNFPRKNSYKKLKTQVNILEDYKISPGIAFMPPLIVGKLLGRNSTTPSLNPIYDMYLHVPEPPAFIGVSGAVKESRRLREYNIYSQTWIRYLFLFSI